MRLARSYFLVWFILVSCGLGIHGQRKPTSDAARFAMDKGIIAAEIPDFALAARYFEEARKIDPNRAAIYYNLGMVESNIPGRELRAVCWLSAYLIREPNDPNATLIREQISRLVSRNAETIRSLDSLLEESKKKMPSGATDDPDGMKTAALAIANADPIEKPADVSRAFIMLAEAQVASGDVIDARRTLDYASETAEGIKNIADKRFTMIDITHLRTRIGRVSQATPIRRLNRVKRPVPTFISAVEWLRLVDDADPTHEAALGTASFMDLSGYLTSNISTTDPQKMVDALSDASRALSEAQAVIEQMLRVPTKDR